MALWWGGFYGNRGKLHFRSSVVPDFVNFWVNDQELRQAFKQRIGPAITSSLYILVSR
jgi:hypothetical protein